MASITLCGLESKPKLNGRTVSLLEYHRARQRFEIEVEGDLPNEDLFSIEWADHWHKPLDENDKLSSWRDDKGPKPKFTELLDTQIQKLKAQVTRKDLISIDCNLRKVYVLDQEGQVTDELADETIERAWQKCFPIHFQKLPSSGKTLGVKPSCLRIREDDSVEKLRLRKVEMSVTKLHAKPQLDGEFGQLGFFQAAKKRWAISPDNKSLWDVKVDGSPCPVLLRSAELLDETSGTPLQDPVQVGPWTHGDGPQRALYANAAFKQGQVILEDDPVMYLSGSNPLALWHQFLQLSDEQSSNVLSLRSGSGGLRCIRKRGGYQAQAEISCEDLEKSSEEFRSLRPSDRTQAWNVLRSFDSNCSWHDHKDGPLLYLCLCRINHSCRPNAILVDPKIETPKYGPDTYEACKKVLIACRDIAEGEEITINYFSDDDLLEPLARRQERTASCGFQCVCQRCKDEASRDVLRSFRCTKCGAASGHVASSNGLHACGACGAEAADAADTLSQEQMHVSCYLEIVQGLSPDKMLTTPDPLVTIAEGAAFSGLAPDHWVLCKVHDILSCFYQKRGQPVMAAQNLEPILGLRERVLGHGDWQRLEALADNLARSSRFAEAFNKYSAALAVAKAFSPEKPAGQSARCDRIRQKLRSTIQGKAPEPE